MSDKDSHILDRERLLSGFLAAVKGCQVRYGGRTELATENDPRVATLCQCLEEIITHGLKSKIPNRTLGAIRQVTGIVSSGFNLNLGFNNGETDHPALWFYVRELLTRHEYDRFMMLRQVKTNEGRGRAWLRSLLNEHSLERYIHILVSERPLLELWYESWAMLRDQERSAMLPNLAAGLDSILFAINIDNEMFDDSRTQGLKNKEVQDPMPEDIVAQIADATNEDTVPVVKKSEYKKRKKKIPGQLVSFDDNILSSSKSHSVSSSFHSAPPTGFNSPSVPLSGSTSFTPYADGLERIAGQATCKDPIFSVNQSGEITYSRDSTHLEHTVKPNYDGDSESLDIGSMDGCSEQPYNKVLEDLLLTHNDSGSTKGSIGLNVAENIGSFSDCDQSGPSSLTPFHGGPSGLIPLTHEGETNFQFSTGEDHSSFKSSSQDECENYNVQEDIDFKSLLDNNEASAELSDTQQAISSSCSLGSIQSMAFALSPTYSKASTLTVSSFSSLTIDELRSAVLEISRVRDSIEEKRNEISLALNKEMEVSSTLRAQLALEKSNHSEVHDKLAVKINALTRENELLRHQLKKYIGAVQMLRRDGIGSSEGLAQIGENSCGEATAPQPNTIAPDLRDYYHEAEAYESKLIQVAEMHGELMEFNEKLQKLLKIRESQLSRLKEELIELRGPLPDDGSDLDNSIYDANECDIVESPRILINIWIPTAFLAGPSNDTHHVYQIYVRIKDDEWNVYRRFAQFYELHRRFKKKEPIIKSFDFPQKKTFGNKDISVVEDRRQRLQQYLRSLVNVIVNSNPNLSFEPNKVSLSAILPFLVDLPHVEENTGNRKRKFLSRLSNRSTQVNDAPQYNGL